MTTWLVHVWDRIRGSLWAWPGLMSVAAALLAYGAMRLDRVIAEGGAFAGFLYHGSPEGVRTLLSTVAGSMITVAGVSFSVTMVALSLASTQLGPRLLASFMRDRGNQLVLGGFIGTFLYCVLALGSVRDDRATLVSVSASGALVLAVGSLVLLIYFIHHIASSMQADQVVDEVARGLARSMDRIFPRSAPEPSGTSPWPEGETESTFLVSSRQTGYVQSVDEPGLLSLAVEQDLRLDVLCRAGHFVVSGTPVVSLEGDMRAETERRIQAAFLIGGHRTAEQDPEFGVHQLVEIAVRALSPGINDPFTACACVDRLSGVLAAIADRPQRPPLRYDAEGNARIRLDPIEFPGLLDAAFDQIRQGAVGMPAVSIRMLEALAAIVRVTPNGPRREALARHAHRVFEGCGHDWNADDRASLEERHRAVQEALASPDAGLQGAQ